METPEDTVVAAFAAINAEDWHELTVLCDPVSLPVFKKQTFDLLHDSASAYSFVNEYGDEHFDFYELLHQELADTSSIEEVEAMDPGRVFVRWLQAHSGSRFRSKEPETCQDWSQECRPSRVRTYKYSVLGSIRDAPDVAHVLYRPTASPAESYPEAYESSLKKMSDEERQFVESMHHRGNPIVVTCRRQGDGSWKLVAKRH